MDNTIFDESARTNHAILQQLACFVTNFKQRVTMGYTDTKELKDTMLVIGKHVDLFTKNDDVTPVLDGSIAILTRLIDLPEITIDANVLHAVYNAFVALFNLVNCEGKRACQLSGSPRLCDAMYWIMMSLNDIDTLIICMEFISLIVWRDGFLIIDLSLFVTPVVRLLFHENVDVIFEAGRTLATLILKERIAPENIVASGACSQIVRLMYKSHDFVVKSTLGLTHQMIWIDDSIVPQLNECGLSRALLTMVKSTNIKISETAVLICRNITPYQQLLDITVDTPPLFINIISKKTHSTACKMDACWTLFYLQENIKEDFSRYRCVGPLCDFFTVVESTNEKEMAYAILSFLKRLFDKNMIADDEKQHLSALASSSPKLCCICMENTANVLLKPCMHDDFCMPCFQKYENQKFDTTCPICRMPIEIYNRVTCARNLFNAAR
jgi:hypothetical protein